VCGRLDRLSGWTASSALGSKDFYRGVVSTARDRQELAISGRTADQNQSTQMTGPWPNLTATVLQTGCWKLGKPPSRLRQRCAVQRLRAASRMPGLSPFAIWRQWWSGKHRKALFFPGATLCDRADSF